MSNNEKEILFMKIYSEAEIAKEVDIEMKNIHTKAHTIHEIMTDLNHLVINQGSGIKTIFKQSNDAQKETSRALVEIRKIDEYSECMSCILL